MFRLIQPAMMVIRFLATALRTPQHAFHADAWNLLERHRAGRLKNTISTLALLGCDVDLLDHIGTIVKVWGPDWIFLEEFGGPVGSMVQSD